MSEGGESVADTRSDTRGAPVSSGSSARETQNLSRAAKSFH